MADFWREKNGSPYNGIMVQRFYIDEHIPWVVSNQYHSDDDWVRPLPLNWCVICNG